MTAFITDTLRKAAREWAESRSFTSETAIAEADIAFEQVITESGLVGLLGMVNNMDLENTMFGIPIRDVIINFENDITLIISLDNLLED